MVDHDPVGELIATVSHDLRQPLHAMALLLAALTRRVPDGEARDLAGKLDMSLRALRDMIDALIELARPAAAPPQAEPVAIDALFERLHERFAAEAEASGLRLALRPTEHAVAAPAGLLELALRQLLAGALQAASIGVVVAARRRGATLRIEVWHAGPGRAGARAPAADVLAERLLARAGLTLELCRRPAHGGRAALSPPLAALATVPDAPTGTETILLVDDNADVRDVTALLLRELGYRVLAVAGGTAALALLDDGTPVDLLLTDIVMPGDLSGDVLAAEAQRRRPALKVLLATGYANPALRGPLLRKPFRKLDLALAVRAVLSPAA